MRLLSVGRAFVAAVLLTTVLAAPAQGATTSQERAGAALMREVNGDKRSCASLSTSELDDIGEYAMGLGFISGPGHEAMDARMRGMMGEGGERQAHRAMGRSYSGCGDDEVRGAMGPGMMDGSGGRMMGVPYGSGGMMSGSAYGPGAMRSFADDGGVGTGTVILIALAAALLGAGVTALVGPRLRRGSPTAAAT